MSEKLEREVIRMEKLATRLSLPHRSRYNAVPDVERPVGLPINALPGWESIPLHSKLPMLKCPDNQVIFSKNKIGRTFESYEREFDSVCLNAKMEYNPLHDRHLKRFYSNEKLLKRLRENGEITENNDVICTLKDFNEYRIPLHEAYLTSIRTERNRLNDEKRDKQMIKHAEIIAERAQRIKEKNASGSAGVTAVLARKAKLERQRALRNNNIRLRNMRKEQQLEASKAIQETLLHHKKELHNYRIQRHLDLGLDIQRKRLIALKKHLQFKSDRLQRSVKHNTEYTARVSKEKATQSWEMHLLERTAKHEQTKMYTKEVEDHIQQWIKNHMEKYKKKWAKIQMTLDSQAHHPKQKKKKIQQEPIESSHGLQTTMDPLDKLNSMAPSDIQVALKTAVKLEEEAESEKKQAQCEDSIFKVAKYILERILYKFNKDLSSEKYIEEILCDRLMRIFEEAHSHVLKRACLVISRTSSTEITGQGDQRESLLRSVSFNQAAELIGQASYELEGKTQNVHERPPTPAGSLTSVVIDDDNITPVVRVPRTSFYQLDRDERFFIEHLVIKFKRRLLVGIGKQVLFAIDCHKRGKIASVRNELEELDKNFLGKLMARSILSYAVNPSNFHSNSLLCQHAIAGDIITFLQKDLLKPARDPRLIAKPHLRCNSPWPPLNPM